jgi:hypothetical protein
MRATYQGADAARGTCDYGHFPSQAVFWEGGLDRWVHILLNMLGELHRRHVKVFGEFAEVCHIVSIAIWVRLLDRIRALKAGGPIEGSTGNSPCFALRDPGINRANPRRH